VPIFFHRFLSCLLLFVFAGTNSFRGQAGYRDSIRHSVLREQLPAAKSECFVQLSGNYIRSGHFDSARLAADEGMPYARQSGDPRKMASLYYNKGISYLLEGINASALENLLKGLKLVEPLHDSVDIASYCNIVGVLYQRMKAYDKALAWWKKGIGLVKRDAKTGQEQYMDYYGNLGSLYTEELQYDSALSNYNKSLLLSQAMHANKQTAISFQNIGDVYIRQKKYAEALDFTKRSINLTKDYKEDYGTAQLYLNMGLISKGLKQYPEAHTYFEKALELEKGDISIDDLRQIYEELAGLNEEEHDYAQAYKNHLLFTKFKDSIYNQQNLTALSDLKASYEIDKEQEEMDAKEKVENLRRDVEMHRQKLIDTALGVGFLLLGIGAFFLYRSYRIKKKANVVIVEQQYEIAHKNSSLVQINKEISDSINYAKYIQQAILPPLDQIRKSCPSSFILFQPKNVVSGDFYFFKNLPDGEVILAACDCTGHGVPGAFMSMIGSEQLGKIISEWKITRPADILNELHKGVMRRLRQDSTESRDGMDVALCKINLQTGSGEYAGANRPMWIFREGESELAELKPDKRPVGGMDQGQEGAFANTGFKLKKGDKIYLFSDGYADQFGGEKNKKMMVRNFKKFLLSIIHLPMQEQEQQLFKKFKDWKGNHEQVDDILIVGLQV
jgi:serine phosphatase RsbU (regulator of sigma subunit)/tetratricopeptide (TPR) repeat protein